MIDTYNTLGISGFLEIRKRTQGQDWKLEHKSNIVVNNAREIIRDLVYGQRKTPDSSGGAAIWEKAPTITALGLGNMGMELAEAQISVPEASVDDKTLVNPTFWIPVTDEVNFPNNSVEVLDYKGRKSIKYTFVMSQEQGNTSGFYCELGLAIDTTRYPDAYLFTKLNKTPPIVKTESDEISIIYYLSF